jgi:hypothetical protein
MFIRVLSFRFYQFFLCILHLVLHLCCMLAEVLFWGADWLDWVLSVVGQLSEEESLVG